MYRVECGGCTARRTAPPVKYRSGPSSRRSFASDVPSGRTSRSASPPGIAASVTVDGSPSTFSNSPGRKNCCVVSTAPSPSARASEQQVLHRRVRGRAVRETAHAAHAGGEPRDAADAEVAHQLHHRRGRRHDLWPSARRARRRRRRRRECRGSSRAATTPRRACARQRRGPRPTRVGGGDGVEIEIPRLAPQSACIFSFCARSRTITKRQFCAFEPLGAAARRRRAAAASLRHRIGLEAAHRAARA